MVYVSGGKIQAEDYNNLAILIRKLFGTGDGNSGYGGNSLLSPVPVDDLPIKIVGDLVTSADWANLRNAINDMSVHQGTTLTDALPAATLLEVGDLLTFFSTLDSTPNETSLNTNRLVVDLANVTTTTKLTVIRTNPWSTIIRHEFITTYANADEARFFFNTGGQLKLSASRTGGDLTSAQNISWTQLVSDASPFIFDHINYYALTGSFVPIASFQLSSGAGYYSAYPDNVWTISARRDDVPGPNNSNGSIIRFRSDFNDVHADPVTDIVDGTFTSTIEERRSIVVFGKPSPTFVTITALLDPASSGSDDVPNPFAFTDQTNVPRSTDIISNTLLITGLDIPASVTASNGGILIKNGIDTVSSSGFIENNDTLAIKLASSSLALTQTDSVVTIGGIVDTFSVTTEAAGIPINISVNTFNFNLFDELTSLTLSTTNGKYDVNVLTGVIVGSTSASTPAFTTGAVGSSLDVTVTVTGQIRGGGGTGGNAGFAGQNAGTALNLTIPITLNGTGSVWGGGGGGGAAGKDGDGITIPILHRIAGNGGAGVNSGAGGTGETPGVAGTINIGGGGGDSAGDGGNPGVNGFTGADGPFGSGFVGGLAGNAATRNGNALDDNSFITSGGTYRGSIL